MEKIIYSFEMQINKNVDRNVLKRLLSIMIKNPDNDVIDHLLWGYSSFYDMSLFQEARLVLAAILKIKPKLYIPFLKELKKIVKKTYSKNPDVIFFLKIIYLYEPLWVLRSLEKSKGILDNKLINFFNDIKSEYEQYNNLSNEIDDIFTGLLQYEEREYSFFDMILF